MQHDFQNIVRERIEEIEAVFILHTVFPGVLTNKVDTLFVGIGDLRPFKIKARLLIEISVKLDPGRAAARHGAQKEHGPAKPASIVQNMIICRNIAAFCQGIQNSVIRRFVVITVHLEEVVDHSGSLNIQFLLPPLF